MEQQGDLADISWASDDSVELGYEMKKGFRGYKIEKTNIKTAQEFWDSSPEATFFTNPFVISKIEKNLDFWIVQKGNENICLWPICKNSENRTFIPVFFYYFGPFCSNYY